MEIGGLMVEEKESQMMIESLEEEMKSMRPQTMDVSQYKSWSWMEIFKWIMSIEDGRFAKYEGKLKRALSQEKPSGDDIEYVNGEDIKRWGITHFRDIKILKQYIDQLGNDHEGTGK